MKVLGIRIGPQKTRVAIVKRINQAYKLICTDTDSRLVYPADMSSPVDKVLWLYREFERLYNEHTDIEKICIKTNEFTRIDNKSKRETAYLEGVVLLFCRQIDIPVDIKNYASLGTNSSEVKDHAEQRVGRTERYWDVQMADAIVAAWQGIRA